MTSRRKLMDTQTELAGWLGEPEVQAGIDQIVRRAINALDAEVPPRLPGDGPGRRRAFGAWLSLVRSQMPVLIDREFRAELPLLAPHLPSNLVEVVVAVLLPQVDQYLRSMAARSAAAE